MGNRALLTFLLVISFFSLTIANSNPGDVATEYPGLFERGLRSALLSNLPKDQLFIADSITITRAELEAEIAKAPAAMQKQLTDNSFFMLEEMATQKILLSEAKLWARLRRINIEDMTDSQVLQKYFEHKVQDITIDGEDVKEFYRSNPGIFGEVKFEEVSNYLENFVLQEKKSAFIAAYIDSLSERTRVFVNSQWAKEQYPNALNNPVNKARNSGKPTLVEFGATGCGPCDLMAPILAQLKQEYGQKLNVEIINVQKEQLLAARYGISSIPVQIFFDSQGTEFYRHVGFFSKDKIEAILVKMEVGE
jgi:thiol-disulfide isomerase/thioredoxin